MSDASARDGVAAWLNSEPAQQILSRPNSSHSAAGASIRKPSRSTGNCAARRTRAVSEAQARGAACSARTWSAHERRIFDCGSRSLRGGRGRMAAWRASSQRAERARVNAATLACEHVLLHGWFIWETHTEPRLHGRRSRVWRSHPHRQARPCLIAPIRSPRRARGGVPRLVAQSTGACAPSTSAHFRASWSRYKSRSIV